MKRYRLTGVSWLEGNDVVSKCPELGVASCGATVEEAMGNLRKGAVRELTPGEIEKLKQSAGLE